MIEIFTQTQQKVIEEKKEHLQKIIDGTLSPNELASMIIQRRLNWLENSRNLWEEQSLSLEDAYKLLIYHHTKVENGILISVNRNLLRIRCRNFCLYLEASKILGLDTRLVCKEIGELSLRAFFQRINLRFHFSRDYNHIRPIFKFLFRIFGGKIK